MITPGPRQSDRNEATFEMLRSPGAFIRLRRKLGLSQSALAAAIGVSVSSVRAWEHGRRTPSLRSLLRISYVLGVRPNQLA